MNKIKEEEYTICAVAVGEVPKGAESAEKVLVAYGASPGYETDLEKGYISKYPLEEQILFDSPGILPGAFFMLFLRSFCERTYKPLTDTLKV